MTAVTLRRYVLPSVQGQGWAIVVLGSDGYFSAVSDYGNYAYIWSAHGCADFREFAADLEKDPHYAVGKLWPHPHEYDGEATFKNAKRMIKKRAREDVSFDSESERWTLVDHDELNTEFNFHDWLNETDLPSHDAYECRAERPNPQALAFCEKILPRLAEVLRAEMAKEKEGAA